MSQLIVLSDQNNPYLNLAYEMYLFDHVKEGEEILFLYFNEPSVVIGRNQNPWQEVFIDNAKLKNIHVVRRVSGGGTVYHDESNLNYAFIYNRSDRSYDLNFKVIIKSLKSLQIPLELTSRNDLFYKTKKVSGNAFYNKGKKCLHHGTLLYNVQMDHLWDVLKFNHINFHTKSIVSVKSPVVNLKQINSQITKLDLVNSIVDTFKDENTTMQTTTEYFKHHHKVLKEKQKAFCGWAWIYGETPKFIYHYDKVDFHVKKGKIYEIEGNNKYTYLKNQAFDEDKITKEVEHVSRVV